MFLRNNPKGLSLIRSLSSLWPFTLACCNPFSLKKEKKENKGHLALKYPLLPLIFITHFVRTIYPLFVSWKILYFSPFSILNPFHISKKPNKM